MGPLLSPSSPQAHPGVAAGGTAYVSLSSGSTACQGQTSPSPYVKTRSEGKKTGAAGLITQRSRGWGGDCGQATPDPNLRGSLGQPYAWPLSTANRHTTKRQAALGRGER